MSWTTRSLRLAALPLLALSIAAGCAEDNPTGNLSVDYKLGLQNNCMVFDVAIETITVTVGAGIAQESAPCDPTEPIVLSGVKAGTHDLSVQAIDAEDFVVMDNVAAPEEDDRVEIHGGSSTEVEADLAATPAELQVRWQILDETMFPVMCNQSTVTFFDVTAYQDGGNSVLFGPHEFECEQPEAGYHTVPDPDREINGTHIDNVAIDVKGMNDATIDTVPFAFDPPGPGRLLKFTLTCTGPAGEDPDCDGTLDMPPGMGGSASATGGADTGTGTG